MLNIERIINPSYWKQYMNLVLLIKRFLIKLNQKDTFSVIDIYQKSIQLPLCINEKRFVNYFSFKYTLCYLLQKSTTLPGGYSLRGFVRTRPSSHVDTFSRTLHAYYIVIIILLSDLCSRTWLFTSESYYNKRRINNNLRAC